MRQNVPQSVEIAALDAPDNARSRPGPASYARSVRAARVPGSRFRFIESTTAAVLPRCFVFAHRAVLFAPAEDAFDQIMKEYDLMGFIDEPLAKKKAA
jgi:hypothetical protein